MRSPPKRPDGKEWSSKHRKAAALLVRAKQPFEVSVAVGVKEDTIRSYEKLDGWDALLAWERAELVRADLDGLGFAGLPILQRMLALADTAQETRRVLEDALEDAKIEPGEYALRMSQNLKVERESLRDFLVISGFAELRLIAARKMAVMPSAEAAPENLAQGEAPEPLTPEEERDRALKIAQVFAELGGKVEVG